MVRRAFLCWAELLAGIETPVLEVGSEQDVFSHLSASMNIADDAHSRAKTIWQWIGRYR